MNPGQGALPVLQALTQDDGLLFDLRYATAANWTGRPLYARKVALLHPAARLALLAAAAQARAIGLRLLVFDAFRPLEAQWALFEAAPDKSFAADPREGGTHPRGIAVDLTLAGPDGATLDMGTDFDAVTPLSAHGALPLPGAVVHNRCLLLGLMTACGWAHYRPEWWHYHLPGHDGLPALWAADVPGGPM